MTPDASAPRLRGVHFQPAKGGQFSTGADTLARLPPKQAGRHFWPRGLYTSGLSVPCRLTSQREAGLASSERSGSANCADNSA
jgi:hypothetical protein